MKQLHFICYEDQPTFDIDKGHVYRAYKGCIAFQDTARMPTLAKYDCGEQILIQKSHNVRAALSDATVVHFAMSPV